MVAVTGLKNMADSNIILFRPGDAAERSDEPPDGGSTVSPDDTEEIQRLEAEIAVKRDRVVASFGELRRRVEGATDWRGWVREHPVVWIAGAVSVGFIIGYRGGGARR
jgi:hypothetical protein